MSKDEASSRRGWYATGLCALVVLIWVTAQVANSASGRALSLIIKAHYTETLALLPVVSLLALLGLSVSIDPYIEKRFKHTMRIIVVTTFSLIVQNYLEYRLMSGEVRRLARTLVATYGYIVRPMIIALFLRLIRPSSNLTAAKILVSINAGFYVASLFTGICFTISETNRFHRGPLGNLCLYVSAALLIYLFYLTVSAFHPRRHVETWVPMLVLLFIIGALTLDANVEGLDQPVPYLTIAVVVSSVAYYIWLHLQYVREHEQALVDGQRVQMMLSQIKPHFLYNSLGVIAELCDSDPAMAKAATIQFAQYLRCNMDSLSSENSIPFERELEHTRLYLALEQLRFEDALTVRFEIECTNFSIPPLSLEPLVENAVRHGVRGNPDGRGTVIVSSVAYPDRYEIAVSDDGPGFDPNAPLSDGKSHVGLQNVRERLGSVGGRLAVVSAPGAGTTATISLPATPPPGKLTRRQHHANLRHRR